jgi:hypothetical protein
MSDDERIASNLPEIQRASEGQDGLPVLDRRRAQRRVAADFAAGVRGWGKAQAFATLLDVSEGFLSRASAGKKLPPMWAVDAFRGNAGAVIGYTAGLLQSVSMIAVPLVTEVKLTSGQAELLREQRRILGPVLWPSFLREVALRVFKCEPQLLEVAIDCDLMMGK